MDNAKPQNWFPIICPNSSASRPTSPHQEEPPLNKILAPYTMSIRIANINEHCTVCQGLVPPTSNAFGGSFWSSPDEISESARGCSGCQFLAAVISNASSLGLSGPSIIVNITDGSGGSKPEFRVQFIAPYNDWVYGTVEVYALQGNFETQFSSMLAEN